MDIPTTPQRPYFITVLTSGQVMVWDKDDVQIPEWQLVFKAGEANHELLQILASQCEKFSIGHWGQWRQMLTKEEFFGLLHLKI